MSRITDLPVAVSVSTVDTVHVVQNGQSKQATVGLFPTGLFLESVVVVSEAADLAGTLDSTKVYLIDGTVNLGDQSIEVPTGGLSISGLNGGRDVTQLISSENNYTMFTSPAGSYSGDVLMEGLTISVTGTSSKVFNLDNDGNSNALDISGVNFTSCTSLGELTAYRQLLFSLVGIISVADGLTFSGAWAGGISVINSIAILFPAATLFKEGTALTIAGSIRSNINFLGANASAVLFDFDEANVTADGGMDLNDVRTAATNAIPNLPHTSTKARFRDCIGVDNTYVGAQYTVSSAVATTIAIINTPVKLAGTTTYSEEHWFSNTTDNAFVYDSTLPIEVTAKFSMSFSGTNGNVIGLQFRLWDDSASAYVDLGATFTATMNSAGRAENVVGFATTLINKDDRIEIWVENQTSTANITALAGGFVSVEERQS
jgi:hypothetical protein